MSTRTYFIHSFIIIYLIFVSGSLAQINSFKNQLRLAKSFESSGQLVEAEKIYQKLHSKAPQNFQIYDYLFKNLIAQKKYIQAEKLVKNQINLSPNKVNLFGDLGSVNYLMGNEDTALQIWEEALTLEPDNPFAFRTIANYLIENRLIEYAIDVLERGNAVSKDPTMFSYDIANYYSITMKFEKATEEYCRILESKPTQLTLVKTKIAGYVNANLAEKPTLRTVLKWYESSGRITYLKLLADLYVRTNYNKEAFEAIKIIEQKTTGNGSAIFNFAQQSFRMGNYETASLAYKEIIDNFPASALFSESEIGYTRSLESTLINKNTKNHTWKPVIIEEKIDTSRYLDLKEAYVHLAEKYQNNKIGWEAEFRAARIYHFKLRDLDRAEKLYKKIISESRSLRYQGEANFGLARIAIQNRDMSKAEKYLKKVLSSKLVNNSLKEEANFFLGRIQMWRGEFSNSVEYLNQVTDNIKSEFVNDALQYLLLINTFKNDSTNLLSFAKSDYLMEIGEFDSASVQFKELSDNENLFIMKDWAALKYTQILISLNNYQEAGIFLDTIINCDEDNIFKDRFLYLSGSNYYFGLKEEDKAIAVLSRLFEEFPNSIYFNKARNIISAINLQAGKTL